MERDILKVLEESKQKRAGRILLVIDGLDLLLAATGVDAGQVGEMAGELREVSIKSSVPADRLETDNPQHVHATVITSAADLPLLQSPTTPLEINHAAFVMSVAHQARFTLSLRLLDTGTARDVSGVMRVTKGPDEGEDGEEMEERELLYYVGGDGGVRVFGRGE